jgi:hypothetical protein
VVAFLYTLPASMVRRVVDRLGADLPARKAAMLLEAEWIASAHATHYAQKEKALWEKILTTIAKHIGSKKLEVGEKEATIRPYTIILKPGENEEVQYLDEDPQGLPMSAKATIPGLKETLIATAEYHPHRRKLVITITTTMEY